VWLPQFVCPECATDVCDAGSDRWRCPQCGRHFEWDRGIWRFLTATRGRRLEPFVRQYRAVRQREGRRPSAPEYYRMLPTVPPDDPHAGDWLVRRETYHHLLRHVLASGPQPLHVLDLGAGSGWLSHRLAGLGHHVVAVDAIDDDDDGLGAAHHYPVEFGVVQADFNAVPFAGGQFDLVVFNGSLHYAPDAEATLARAHRLLAPGGALVVMDSPMFHADRDGRAMLEDTCRRLVLDCGISDVVRPGIGYLTFTMLDVMAGKFGLRPQFFASHGPLGWRVRRNVARLRLRRAPAAFGLWVAR
jgi:SAM-dependent methyltransferase